MKKLFIALASTMFVAVSSVHVKANPEIKSLSIKQNVQDEKQDPKTKTSDTKTAKPIATESGKSTEEYQKFKRESIDKMSENDMRIAELRKEKSSDDKEVKARYDKKIDALEKRNQELKTKLTNYKYEKSNWQTFKQEFKHDLDGLGNAFKDFTVRNTK